MLLDSIKIIDMVAELRAQCVVFLVTEVLGQLLVCVYFDNSYVRIVYYCVYIHSVNLPFLMFIYL